MPRLPLKLTAGLCALFALSACTELNLQRDAEDDHPNLRPVRMPNLADEMKAMRARGCLSGQIFTRYSPKEGKIVTTERCLIKAPGKR